MTDWGGSQDMSELYILMHLTSFIFSAYMQHPKMKIQFSLHYIYRHRNANLEVSIMS